jgi:hypothetical protein
MKRFSVGLFVQVFCCLAFANGSAVRNFALQCQGDPFNSSQLVAHYPGGTYGSFGSWSVISEHTRTCNRITGCAGWLMGNPYSGFEPQYASVNINGFYPVSRTGVFYSALSDDSTTVDLELWTGPDQRTWYEGDVRIGRWHLGQSTSLDHPIWMMVQQGKPQRASTGTTYTLQMNSKCMILDVSQTVLGQGSTYIEHTLRLAGQF